MSFYNLLSSVSAVVFMAAAVFFYMYGANFFFQGPPVYVVVVSTGFLTGGIAELFLAFVGDFYAGIVYLLSGILLTTGFLKALYDSKEGRF